MRYEIGTLDFLGHFMLLYMCLLAFFLFLPPLPQRVQFEIEIQGILSLFTFGKFQFKIIRRN